MAEKQVKFEEAMAELNALADKLERGDLPLDQALEAFEKGTRLVQICQKTLKDAELRVEKVLAQAADGSVTTTPHEAQ